MRLKRLLSVFVTGSFILGSITTTFADEQETGTTEKGSWLQEQLINSFSTLDFKLAEVPNSAVLLNLKYMDLQANIIENGYGTNYEITLPDSLKISGNATDLFNKEYGDIDFSLDKIDIPEDFNAEKILQNSKDMVNAGYSEFINSEKYQNIYNSVSTSAVTNEIDKQISSSADIDKLMGSDKMKELLDKYNDDDKVKNDYYSAVESNKHKTESTYHNKKLNYIDSKNADAKLIEAIKTKVKNETASELAVIDKEKLAKYMKACEDSGILGYAYKDRVSTLNAFSSNNDKNTNENVISFQDWLENENRSNNPLDNLKEYEPGSIFKR